MPQSNSKPFNVSLNIKLLLIVLVCFKPNSVSLQIIDTKLGSVRGTTLTARGGREFFAYLGLPYALPPLGPFRFLDPIPAGPWNGTRDGTKYGPVCPQFGNYVAHGVQDEDCLTLNIFTPFNETQLNKTKDELLPVLVYLHGGYFMALSASNYGPKYFMEGQEIVLVTLNYRLGVLGFVSTEDEHAPGNAGIKDQVMALKWIKENINFFGGDPSRITIYGESAGGAAVHYHLLSPLSRGLFSGAISSSGTAFKVLSHQLTPLNATRKMAAELGCSNDETDTKEMIECLRKVDVSEIAKRSNEFMKTLKDPLRTFSPSTEVNGTSPSPFLTQKPYDIHISGGQLQVPWMVGVNSGEGFQITWNIAGNQELINQMNSNWTAGLAEEYLLLKNDDDGSGSGRIQNVTGSIDKFYLKTVTPNGSVNFLQDLLGFTDLFTDRLYVHASVVAARNQAKKSPVFFYYNDYITTDNPHGLGTVHGEELILLFSPANFSHPIIDEGHPDYEQSKAMVDLWVQFIKDPHHVYYRNEKWNQVNPAERDLNGLIFRSSGRGEQGFGKLPTHVKNRIDFWEEDVQVPPYQEH